MTQTEPAFDFPRLLVVRMLKSRNIALRASSTTVAPVAQQERTDVGR